MKRKEKGRRVFLEGIVTPSAWDDQFRIIAVKISASGEKDYLVTGEEKGKELLNLVSQKLKITGDLHESENGNPMVTITSYESIGY